MAKDDLKKLYDVLELPLNAPLRDVHNSFMRLRKLYSGESIVLEPLGDDFSDKKKKKILEQIEEAYAKILASRSPEGSRTEPLFSAGAAEEKLAEPEDPAAIVYSGPRLRKARDARNVTLNEVSKELKLRLELLNNLEADRFETLPEAIYLKAQLRTYAAFLGLPPAKVAEDYLQRYRIWKAKTSPPPPEAGARRHRS
jgi:hypothetical protein